MTSPRFWTVAILASPELSPDCKAIATAIATKCRADSIPIGYRAIAAACGKSRSKAIRAVRTLETRGWLAVARTNLTDGEANSYHLVLPAAEGKGGAA